MLEVGDTVRLVRTIRVDSKHAKGTVLEVFEVDADGTVYVRLPNNASSWFCLYGEYACRQYKEGKHWVRESM